jgi:hypothetical protein
VATLVAVPVALAIVGISLWTHGGLSDAVPAGQATSPPVPGATGPVPMAAPALSTEVAAACRAVVAKLPDAVRDLSRRQVTAGAEQNAAYGDPALTLACGIAQPSFAPTAEVYPLAGVCWLAQPNATGTVWTTVDRAIPVAVTVPGPQNGSAQSVLPLARTIATTDPTTASPPPGCA